MGLRRKGEGLVSWVVLYARDAGTGCWRGAADGGALGDMGCWATKDGRESLERVSAWPWNRETGGCWWIAYRKTFKEME